MTPDARRRRGDGGRRIAGRSGWTGAVLLAALILGAGCAGNPPARTSPEAMTASEHFDEAVSARERGDIDDAVAGLRTVRRRCAGQRLGRRAFLLLVATRLDPRYRSGPPDSAASGTARYLSRDSVSRWSRAMVESLHLIARDLGGYSGTHSSSAGSGSRTDGSDCGIPGKRAERRSLPTLSRPSLHARVRDLRGTVDSLRAEVIRLRKLLQTPPP